MTTPRRDLEMSLAHVYACQNDSLMKNLHDRRRFVLNVWIPLFPGVGEMLLDSLDKQLADRALAIKETLEGTI